MAKEKKGLTIKEDTLNQIIEAQKEKIGALTDYGKKLKKQLKECKEDHTVICEDIEENYQKELLLQEHIHQKVLVMATIGALLFGVFLGMII